MAGDAGMILLTFPLNGQATDAANGVTLTTAVDKAFFWAPHALDVVEVGCLIGTATSADTLAFTVASAPATGGAFTVFATVTGPVATIIAAGTRLKKDVGAVRLNAGDVLRFTVSDLATAGTGQFYAVCYPAGDAGTGSEIVVSST
jgi:hypothetical protein